jgi:hypothetical protein
MFSKIFFCLLVLSSASLMRMTSPPLIRISEALLHLTLALFGSALAAVLSRGHVVTLPLLPPLRADTGEPLIMETIICLRFTKRSCPNLRLYGVAWNDVDGKRSCPNFGSYPGICPDELKKTTRSLNRNLCPDRDSNRIPSKHN